jgi:uncharacterized Zn finger protein
VTSVTNTGHQKDTEKKEENEEETPQKKMLRQENRRLRAEKEETEAQLRKLQAQVDALQQASTSGRLRNVGADSKGRSVKEIDLSKQDTDTDSDDGPGQNNSEIKSPVHGRIVFYIYSNICRINRNKKR